MLVTDIISITELSRLTGKSRPTIYKYINNYIMGNLDEIPFSIIQLFRMVDSCSKEEIIAYCNKTYRTNNSNCDDETQEVINLILKNKEKLNINKIKSFILEEIKNDKRNEF